MQDSSLTVKRMMAATRMAVVGASDNPTLPSRAVVRFLLQRGKQVLPVNPNYKTVLGQSCYPDLKSLPEPPQVVVVFRKAEACPEVAREAVAVGARGLWLQMGITSPKARQIASDHGLDYVEDRCIKTEMIMSRR